MKEQNIQMFLIANQKSFNGSQIPFITQKLQEVSDDKYMLLTSAEFKDPTMVLILSILFGTLGIDRFIIGDIGMGVLKLLTVGGCGIIAIYDWFTITKRTKEKNFEIFMQTLDAQISFNGDFQSAASDDIESLKKYKQLLDEGTITQEEFEKIKEKLL